MKLQRLFGALSAGLLLISTPAPAAEQSSYVMPVAGPMSMATFAGTHLNPALRALATCHNGSSAPANGTSGAALAYQCWIDTTANPSLYKIYNGTSWITLGSINTSTHVWLPYLTGGTSGGVPYFSANNVMGTSAALAQYGFVVGGGAGAAPATITACTDDQIPFGVTSSSPVCRSVTGDVTFATGVATIGATKVTSAMLNADVFSTAHSWGGTQTFTAPVLGTPASGTLTNATGLPISTGVSGLAAGIAPWLATSSSANLATAVTDETGSGALVFGTSPSLTTPTLGVATATSINKMAITAPAIWSTLAVADGKTATISNTLTFTGTDSSSVAFGAGGTVAYQSRNVSTGCGLAGGGDLSADRTIRLSLTVNSQTGTSYTVLDGDCGKLVRLNNGSSVAVGLPQASTLTNSSGWSVDFQNIGAGTVTITPTTSTINGGANLVLTQNQGAHCTSDGTNYTCVLGVGSGGGSGVTSIVCNGLTIASSGTCPEPFGFENCSLAASVATNILTVALKDNSGSDPSSTSPCRIAFRSATAATGTPSFNSVTGALSITTNATGATLGSSNNTAFRFWVVAFDNAGTTVLSLYNASDANSCTGIDESLPQSSTAISGSATAVATFYTPNGTTLASKSIRIMGWVEYDSAGLATAGTYASAPDFIQIFGHGTPPPCSRVGLKHVSSASQTNTTSTSFVATAVNTALTPKSAANKLTVRASGTVFGNAAGTSAIMRLHRGSNTCTTAIGSGAYAYSAGSAMAGAGISEAFEAPNSTSSQAYTACITSAGGTNTASYPYTAGGTGVMIIEEIQG